MKQRIVSKKPVGMSVCIPAYEMGGYGATFLKQSFDILERQTFRDFEVVVSDHSRNDTIKLLCDEYADKLAIVYHKFEEKRGNSSANVNNAIKHASGDLVKILFQDDFLYDEKSLEIIVDNFDKKKDRWLVTASEHSRDGVTFFRPFYPVYNSKIHRGKNTISSPSVLTILNDEPLLFDDNLKWFMDGDYYKMCYDAYGLPKIVNTVAVVNRLGDHQITNTQINDELVKYERRYIRAKHKEGLRHMWQKLLYKFLGRKV